MATATEPLRVEFEITLEDFFEAHHRHVRALPAWYRQWDLWAIVGAGVALAWQLGRRGPLHGADLLIVTLLIGAAAGTAAWKIAGLFLYSRWRRKVAQSYNGWKCRKHMVNEISEEAFVQHCSCGTDLRNWQAFTRFVETESLVLLYAGNTFIYFAPKRAFTPQQLEQFRDLLRRKLPAGR